MPLDPDYGKRYKSRHWGGMTVPLEQPSDPDRVIVHNVVVPQFVDQPPGMDGFRVWTQLMAPDLKEWTAAGPG